MNTGIHTVIYPVDDLAAAKTVYQELLGVEPYVDEPYYVGFRVGDQEFGLDPNGMHKTMTTYFHVDDIHALVGRLQERGATADGEPRDVGGGKLVVSITDADGNVFGLSQEP